MIRKTARENHANRYREAALVRPAPLAVATAAVAVADAPSEHPAAKYMRKLFFSNDIVCIWLIHSTETYIGKDGNKYSRIEKWFQPLATVTDEEAMSQLQAFNDAGWHVYVCMNPFKEQTGKAFRTKIMVDAVRSVYIEIDENGDERLGEILSDALFFGGVPEPHFILQSSPGKYQVVWLVDGIMPHEQESLNKALQVKYGGDPASVDVVRVLRLPGFVNCKPVYANKPVVTIEVHGGARYTLADFNIDITVARKSEPCGEAMSEEKISARQEIVEKAMQDAGIDFTSLSETGKADWKYQWIIPCPNAHQHTTAGDTAAVALGVDGRLGFGCFHAHCAGHDWKWFRAHLEEKIGRKIVFETGGVVFGSSASESAPPSLDENEPEPEPITEGLSAVQIEHGVELLPVPIGPVYPADIFYGPAGRVIKKIEPFNESHPVGMYLNLLISLGNIFGRGAYFNVDETKHYTNENLICAGASAISRKGTGRDSVESFLRPIDSSWHSTGGFNSAQGIISEIKDESSYSKYFTKERGYKTVVVPGVDDKRLLVHEGEISGLLKLAGDPKTTCAELIRNAWDGKPIRNKVAGKDKDGASMSLCCREPHVSISGDSTPGELRATMPVGADTNGFGNRFLYCWIYRTKIIPDGGPKPDLTDDIVYFQKVVSFARASRFMPWSAEARPVWKRWYSRLEKGYGRLKGTAGSMTARGPAHVRRLAMILALIDLKEEIGVEHFQAAVKIWEYCRESARVIFNGYTAEQERILDYAEQHPEGVTLREIREGCFAKHRTAEWVKVQVDSLADARHVTVAGDKVKFKRR